jgi:hypothetical protein
LDCTPIGGADRQTNHSALGCSTSIAQWMICSGASHGKTKNWNAATHLSIREVDLTNPELDLRSPELNLRSRIMRLAIGNPRRRSVKTGHAPPFFPPSGPPMSFLNGLHPKQIPSSPSLA